MTNETISCREFNPCTRNGYCREVIEGTPTCECKFWWEGDRCDRQSQSGIQVIVLGCLLGALVILFYTLQIVRCVLKRRKQPKQQKEKPVETQKKLLETALQTARRRAHLRSFITAGLSAILATAGLLGKWALIQPIHNEIVRKFVANESIYYVEPNACKVFEFQNFNIVTISVAGFLILVFIVRSRRVNCFRDKCGGYGAMPMPIDFLSHYDRKFAAFVFAICSDALVAILVEVLNGGGAKGNGVIVTYLLRLLTVLILSIRYFPLLASVYFNTILTLSLGTIYAWLDFSLTVLDLGMCKPDFYPSYEDFLANTSSIDDSLKYYGTGPALIAIQLCTDIPRFLCLSYISVKIPMKLIRKIYRRFKTEMSPEKRTFMKLPCEQRILIRIAESTSVEMLYVKNLFLGPKNRIRSQSLMARIIPKFIYEWRDDFRFSTRIICVYASILLLLYLVTIELCVQVVPSLESLQEALQIAADALTNIFYPLPEPTEGEIVTERTSNFPLPKLIRPYLFAIHITFVLIVIQLLVFLANVRRNLFQAYRGDDSEIPRRHRSKYVSYSSGNVHFAGYFIGYLIWGYILIAIFASLICFAIEGFITYGSVRLVEKILKLIIPSLLFVFFKQYLNKILAQYVFLQHYGEVLALNNRRILMIFIYFNFFLDAFLGFISSIVRLLKSLIGGVLYMCRLDYSPLGRKLETFDGGFSAYCGFIHTECTHRHPVMLIFVSILYNQMRMKHREIEFIDDNQPAKGEKYRILQSSSSRFRRKWKLSVFLIRNPSIVFFRKAYLNQFHVDDLRPFGEFQNSHEMENKISAYKRRMSVFQHQMTDEKDRSSVQNQRF